MIDRASASSPVRSPSTKNAVKTDPTVPLGRVSTSRAATESVQDGARLLDKSWEVIQRKTFTNWINNQLKTQNIPPIVDLNTDLSSGERLIQLLEIIGDESLGRYTRNPRLRLQKIENANKALDFIKKRGVNLTNIGAEDIVDSNPKLLLGLIWTIILRFTISNISEEGLSAKEGLLLWCQRRTVPYAADFTIKEFTFSWQDGLALCGLIHRHRPDLLNYWALNKRSKQANTQLAFDIAEKHLGIPKLFAVEDLCDVVKPDERSVMTYVAQYFHAFSVMDQYGVAGRRVGNFGQVLQQSWEMQNDYEVRATTLINNLNDEINRWSSIEFQSLNSAREQLKEFETYKATTKRNWVAERRELDTLLGNIQTKLKTYNLKPYYPPDGLNPQDIQEHWKNLVNNEAHMKQSLTKYISQAKDELRQEFAVAANNFQESLNAISHNLAELSGDLELQLSDARDLSTQFEPLKESLANLEELDSALVQAHIDDNEFTIYSIEDLKFDLSLILQSVSKKISFIENQMIARTKTNFTPAQLEQYSQTFRIFDKDNSNTLKRDEFKAALAAEGLSLKEDEFEATFLKVSQGSDEIDFENFIEYARQLEEDKTSPDQLKTAFSTLAGENNCITEADLYRGGLTPDIVEYLKSRIVHTEQGYDYNAFLNDVFASQ